MEAAADHRQQSIYLMAVDLYGHLNHGLRSLSPRLCCKPSLSVITCQLVAAWIIMSVNKMTCFENLMFKIRHLTTRSSDWI